MECELQRRRERERAHHGARETAIIPTFEPAINPSQDEEIPFLFLFTFTNLLNLFREFPGLQLRSPSTECARCYQDKHTPKVYSSGNNIDPGLIPPDLEVCHFMKMMYRMGG